MDTMKYIPAKKQITAAISLIGVFAIVASPAIVSAASDTKSTTINATIGATISLTTSGTVAVSLAPTAGGVYSSNSDAVSVSTNNSTGYNLTLADGDATTSLVSGGNNITAASGTFASPAALAAGKWGFAIAGGTGFDASYTAQSSAAIDTSKWAGMPATGSAVTLKSTTTTATADPTTVWYGVAANTSQATGTYTDSVTYTATTKP